MNLDDAMAIFEADLKRHTAIAGIDSSLPQPVDWFALFRRESNTEWLVTNLWPIGRQCHLHAARKTGKSLVSLWMACNLAVGRDPFTGNAMRPVPVAYLDYEMTEDDLLERVEEMGYTPSHLDGKLFYFLHPAIPVLDSPAGGERLTEMLTAYGCEAVIIDTLSRVVAGDESSNDTYIRFFKHSGALLKAAGIALMRLDHEGHTNDRSRGASAKADDVDIVWQLRETDDGLAFIRKAARMAWIPEKLALVKSSDPLAFKTTSEAWPSGTVDKAREMDEVGVPTDASRRKAAEMLKAAGYTAGKTIVLNAALRYRQNRMLGV